MNVADESGMGASPHELHVHTRIIDGSFSNLVLIIWHSVCRRGKEPAVDVRGIYHRSTLRKEHETNAEEPAVRESNLSLFALVCSKKHINPMYM